MRYYIDTCIWLNVIKKEDKFFKSSFDFLNCGKELCISPLILKEIYWKTKEKYFLAKKLMKKCSLEIIIPSKEDYNLARKIEKSYSYCLSFIDFMNIAICKRNDLVLVTRDKDLIKVAFGFIEILDLD